MGQTALHVLKKNTNELNIQLTATDIYHQKNDEIKLQILKRRLASAETSSIVKNFDPKHFLTKLHKKYIK